MKYKNRLKTRLYFAAAYMLFGAVMIILGFLKVFDNAAASTFGAAFLVMGITRIVQYMRIIKSENKVQEMQIKETDERNVMIWTKSKCMAFNIYTTIAAAAIIFLYILGENFTAQIIAYNICLLCVIYFICSIIYNKVN